MSVVPMLRITALYQAEFLQNVFLAGENDADIGTILLYRNYNKNECTD